MSTLAPSYELAGRYDPDHAGSVLLTGVQAIARLLVEQHVRDAAAGLRTASLVSGYQGSPLGGLDQTLAAIPSLGGHDIHLQPGLNEELAATAVWGSQQQLPGGTSTFDGVVGVWYGKSPGVDRAGDAFRHGHTTGAHPRGGVLVLAGDDPAAKSSTLPCASERTLAALGMPVLYPRNSAEVITLGLHGVALSRASGCWVGVKITTDVADGLWSLGNDVRDITITVPRIEWDGAPWKYAQRGGAFPPASLLAERHLAGPRWAMVRAFADANAVDEVSGASRDAWLGIIAPGKAHDAVVQALHDLGLDRRDLERAGVRLLRLGMVHPLAPERTRDFARDLEQVLVVEEKSAFVETQLKALLYGTAGAPPIIGKTDRDDRSLVPAHGELTPDRLAGPLRRVLADRVDVRPAAAPRPQLPLLPVQRTPYFCSGCPHNRSTVVPEGSLAGGGIGCHGMVALMPQAADSFTGLTQMGGEGAQWIGQAPFTDTPHVFQNLGDGTYFHSGQLAVQACVAAGVNITFKILHNAAVAMTGGQDARGAVPVPELTRKLHAEGVRRVIVCAEEPDHYPRDAAWAPGVDVWHRDRLDDAQRLLRDTPGVTVLIYDQQCAAEARRQRKRGQQPVRTQRVLINTEVCEGCGDCGVKSNCLSVQPVETEFGRKTRIDQHSCNTDYSCLDGDCPSFVTVDVAPSAGEPQLEIPEPPVSPDSPPVLETGTHNVLLAGIGGTGIVTVNQVLATAALHDGMRVEGLDQTGLSQKAGPVTSHLRFARHDLEPVNRVGVGQADCLLAFDLLAASDNRQLACLAADRTRAVVSTSRTPTGSMVADPDIVPPGEDQLLERLRGNCTDITAIDAVRAAELLLGDSVYANVLLAGVALQAGALPLSPASVEAAIAINGVRVKENQAAFRWGRLAVADPAAFRAATNDAAPPPAPGATDQPATDLPSHCPLDGETRRLAQIRTAWLEEYQDRRLARRYLHKVETVWESERRVGDRTDLSQAVAKGLHHLMAYKDEYEVARLLTSPAFARKVAEEFPGASRLRFRLHPPILRALGMKRKIAVGPVGQAGLKLLARLRFLRGTPADPFGHTRMRRLERRLAAEYVAIVEHLAATLTPDRYDRATDIAEAALLVRGYEGVKLASVDRYRARLAELGAPTREGVAA